MLLAGLTGATRVDEVLRRAATALGVAAEAQVALRAGSRVLRGGDALAEAGMPNRGCEVELWVGEAGGMPWGCFGFGGQHYRFIYDRWKMEERKVAQVEAKLRESEVRREAVETNLREQSEALREECKAQMEAQLRMQAEAQWKDECRLRALREVEWKRACEERSLKQLQQQAETIARWEKELKSKLDRQLASTAVDSPRDCPPADGASNLDVQAHQGAAAADYSGAYLQTLVWRMAKTADGADRAKEEAVESQRARFKELEAILGARLAPYTVLGLQTGEGEVLRFDAGLDDDEVLLRFFKEVDTDNSGSISKEELMASDLLRKRENAQMAQVLKRSLECDLEALAEALAHFDAKDFGMFARMGRTREFDQAASMKAVFEAANPVSSVFEAGKEGPVLSEDEGRERRVASRADVERLAEAVWSWPEPSRMLAVALEELAKTLPADDQLDFLAFKAAVRRIPRVVGQRVEWAREMGIEALARHLPPGTLDDG